MLSEKKKVALITGASSGIGKSAAELLSKRGWTVYAGYRKTKADIPGCRMVYLDVSDNRSIRRAVALIEREQGRLDALVNNAGYGLFGALEDITPEEFESQYKTNVFGLVETTRQALPMLRRNGGTIVNVSSVVGKVSFPFSGAYSSSKFAVEGISDALRLELKPFKVRVAVIEPGPIRTNFSKKSLSTSGKILSNKKSPYSKYYDRRAKLNRVSAENGLPPEKVGQAIVSACESKNPKTRYLVAGKVAPGIFLKWLLPDKAFDWVLGKIFGL